MPGTRSPRGRALRASTLELVLMLAGILFVRREIWSLHIFDVSMPHWQEGLLLPLSAIDGGISGGFHDQTRHVQHSPSYAKFLTFGVPIFFVLYVACGALCERLHSCVLLGPDQIWRLIGILLVMSGIMLRLWAQMTWTTSGLQTQPPAFEGGQTQPEGKAEQPQSQPASDAPEVVMEKIAATVQPLNKASTSVKGTGGAVGAAQDQLPGTGPYRWLRYPDASGKLLSLCGIPLCFNAWLPLLAVPGIIILLKWHISDQEAYRISQLGEPYLIYRRRTWHFLPFVY